MRALVTVNKSGTAQRVRGSEREGHKEGARSYVRSLSATSTPRHCLHWLLSNIALPVIYTQFPSSVYCFCCCAVVVLVISTICWLDFQLFFLVVLFRSPSLACSLCKKVTFGLNFLRACPPAFSVLIKILSDLILFLSALICDCKRVFRLHLYCNIICFLDHIFLYILNNHF